jgi:tRNA (cytidine/uridine-2'-O-)-methyltransferase
VFHLILYQPEIPPNTGNIIRLCANAGATLHLIHPLGFSLDDRNLKRAGLDYAEMASVHEYASLDDLFGRTQLARLFAVSTRGRRRHSDLSFVPGDAFLFGPETRGLPGAVLAGPRVTETLCIAMRPGCRSLNLANAAAIVLYEAWRQNGFGSAITGRS